MSKVIEIFLQQNPLLSKYIQMKLVNINSLAHYLKKTYPTKYKQKSIPALSMSLRRYFHNIQKSENSIFNRNGFEYRIVTRSGFSEYVFKKSENNATTIQKIYVNLNKIGEYGYYVEGEKEIVLLTGIKLEKQIDDFHLQKLLIRNGSNLSVISIDLPIEMREVVGIYSQITSALAVAQIPIHAFHTIGGEVLILIKNEDQIHALEILKILF